MKKIILFLGTIAFIASCSSNSDGTSDSDNGFDKTAMLTNWADNIIIPSFQNYQSKVNALSTATATFTTTPNDANLEALRTNWLEAYKAYQHVAIFEIGKATEDMYSLRMFSNTYPLQTGPNADTGDLSGVNENIASGTYSLTTISSADEQGFPALDYMLNGLGADNTAILGFYTTNGNASGYKQYLTALTNRLKTISDAIVADWTANFRNTYISSNGSSVNSSTNVTVNTFVKVYEKDIRAGKVGIPAGIYSSGTTYSNKVEALYKNDVSKILLNEAIQASKDFFNGKHFNSAAEGQSLKSYLDYLNTVRSGQKLSLIINNQFGTINTSNNLLSDSFTQQIANDNSKMITAFNSMQQNVLYFKLDMMQALNISVDYVDSDGD
ncbi:imelysin family protein [Flavobacterium sp.]|uniref:imelysin family protein n=1 Tax=Flavobacterium sp. TaxID=239 RepID=UPI003D6AD355